MLKRLNHIAIATTDADAAAESYAARFQMKAEKAEDLPEHGVRVVFLDGGNMKLEFMSPLSEDSPISKFLEKNPKGGIHHICFEVDDIDSSLKHLQNQGVEPVGFPEPKIGAHGKKVIFLSPKDFAGCLLELEEV